MVSIFTGIGSGGKYICIHDISLIPGGGQLITGPSDVGGQCPAPTNKYTSRFGKHS